MELTIYASKKSFEKDGKTKTFYVYSTKLNNKETNEDDYLIVKFKDECGSPAGINCPINIVVEKKDCNITIKERNYIDSKTGEEKKITEKIMWVNKWSEGSPFEDHSTDAYF